MSTVHAHERTYTCVCTCEYSRSGATLLGFDVPLVPGGSGRRTGGGSTLGGPIYCPWKTDPLPLLPMGSPCVT